MATRSVRVFITDARLSYPALDEPKETMAGNGDLKYQATFLIAPDNPCVAKIKDAIKQIAIAEYGDKAKAVVTNREKIPLKKGDDKENIPDGYAGMLYISAKSKNRPELRDANPKIRIIDKEEIREKFTAGYRVNAYVDLYPYAVRNSGGAIIKSGIAAGLVSVQFKAPETRPEVWQLQRLKPGILAPPAMRILTYRSKIYSINIVTLVTKAPSGVLFCGHGHKK